MAPNAQPRRVAIEVDRWVRIPVREDRAVAADIEAVCQGLHRAMMRHDPSYIAPASWDGDARRILAAVFSEVEDG